MFKTNMPTLSYWVRLCIVADTLKYSAQATDVTKTTYQSHPAPKVLTRSTYATWDQEKRNTTGYAQANGWLILAFVRLKEAAAKMNRIKDLIEAWEGHKFFLELRESQGMLKDIK